MSTKISLQQINVKDLELFCEAFSGRENVHGKFVPYTNQKGGTKVSGKTRTLNVGATLADYENHLKGLIGLGINPLKKDNTLTFFVLDVDDYTVEKLSIENKLESLGLKHVTFMSKSGGLHIYFFMREAVPSNSLAKIASELKFFLDLPQSTEFFPKQTTLNEDSLGNWINLPYFGSSRKALVLCDKALVEVDLKHALTLISSQRTCPKEIQACLNSLPMCDAPPCLQKLYLTNERGSLEHCRNKFLFNYGIYCKKSNPTNFEKLTLSLNASLLKPINSTELEKTVLKSLLKKDYEYTCEEDFMKSACCEYLCKTRPFGKFANSPTNLTFGKLTRINYEPPIYVWEVNSKEFVYDSEKDLCSQVVFRDLCIRHLNILPDPIKPKEWLRLINNCLKDIQVEEVAEEEKLSREFVFKSALKSFFASKIFASIPEQFVTGMPYFSQDSKKVFFKLEVFTKYLNAEVALERYSTMDVRKNLRALKASSEKLYITSKHSAYRAWAVDPSMLYDSPEEFDAFYENINKSSDSALDLYDNSAPEINFKEEDF